MILPTFEYEQGLWSEGFQNVAGVDEVGRGALAGPVVAAAVVFRQDHQQILGVKDSKKLSKLQKAKLSPLILTEAQSVGIGEATPQEIDTLGIVPATGLAMQRALAKITNINCLLIDGLPFKNAGILSEYQKKFIVKGDALSYSIAAASIVAKVYRDKLMINAAQQHSKYAFERNVGYGTREHLSALQRCGVTTMHRLSFISQVTL